MRVRKISRARWRQVPPGTRDQLPADTAARRRLEARLLDVFGRWGYEEVATPTLEYLDTLLHGAGPGIDDRLIKLVDSGEVLALRPEMTVPLARLAATRLLPAGRGPLRLAYVASVFRGQERGSGRLREFTQAGVELIGADGPYADAEVIALAAESLRAVGADDAVVSVGHAGFLRGLLSTLSETAAETARDLLYRRAFADLAQIDLPGAAREALRMLPALRGPGALERARPLAASFESREALEALDAVLQRVSAYDRTVRVEVDLGLIRDFDYYSGVVFEARTPRAGLPLLGGGRYDGLLERFGYAAPATGFAIGLERVIEATLSEVGPRSLVALVHVADAYQRAVHVATSLRAAGLAVVVMPTGGECEEAACIVEVGVDEGTLVVRHDNRQIAVPPEAIVRTVSGVLEADAWRR